MFKIICPLICACFLFPSAYSQRSDIDLRHGRHRAHKTGPDAKWGIFTNLLSLAELQPSAIGAGVNYQVARRWDVSAEYSHLFKGIKENRQYHDAKGYRGIFTVKRFSKSRIFFYGIDIRVKYFSFVDVQNFVNPVTLDTLHDISHNVSNTLPGIGGFAGVRLPISANKKFAFEFNAGIGYKRRYVHRKNTPKGYNYSPPELGFTEYDFAGPRDMNEDTFYLPATVRFYYFF